jgi:hypothetical protein
MIVDIRCYYTDPYKGRVYEIVPSVLESDERFSDGMRHGLACPAPPLAGGGYDWYEWPDGTLCHGRRA